MRFVKYTCFFICCLGLQTLLAQDSLNMTRVGHWDPAGMKTSGGVTYNDIWGYTTPTGEEYAIIGNVDSILIVDISDCSNPIRVFGYDGGNTTTWRDFKTFDTYVYAVCDNCSEGLHIFDMSALPGGSVSHELTTKDFFNKAHNIYIDEATQKLYATGTNTATEGVVILDLSATPENPTLLKEVEFDDEIGMPGKNFYVHDIYVRNDTAYASHGYQGYYVWDMTNLNDITWLGDYDGGGYNHSSWTTDDLAYAYYAEEVPTGRPLAILDLANLGNTSSNLSLVTTFENSLGATPNATPHNPFIKDDTLYISYYEDGIKMYDLSTPTAPAYIGYYDTYLDNGTGYNGYNGAWGTYPFFDSGCICVSDIKYGLNVLKYCEEKTYYKDQDGDGYGDQSLSVVGCPAPAGFVLDDTDCDDSNANINPGVMEICDGIDNNCNGQIDEDLLIDYFADADGDGYGDPGNSVAACNPPSGFITDNTDCNDADDAVYPGAAEVCDGLDNDCNGLIDEPCLDPCDSLNMFLTTITQSTYRIKQNIEADATITTNENIALHAGNTIELLPEFEVLSGGEIVAIIEDCDDVNLSISVPNTATKHLHYLEANGAEAGPYLLTKDNSHFRQFFETKTALRNYLLSCSAVDKYILIEKAAN